jgi:hypothetical protein
VIPIPLRSIGLTHGGSQVKSGLSILQKKFYTTHADSAKVTAGTETDQRK